MSSPALRIGLIQINVTDLDEAWRFYVETLGIPGRRNLGPNHPFELDLAPGGGAAPTVLVYPVGERTRRAYPDETGVTLVFHTENVYGTVEEWKTRGVEFIPIAWSRDESGIADTPFGPFVAFRDPFGNVHELLQPAPDPPHAEEPR
jgi:catechol 2,3-dioxygenase-like lactoylglutathione lyase family enzyme